MNFEITVKHDEGIGFKNQPSLNEQLSQVALLESAKLFKHFQLELLKGTVRNRNVSKSRLSWDLLHHENIDSLYTFEPIETLMKYGISINGLKEVENRYQKRKKRHDFKGVTLEEYMKTTHYQNAVDKVLARYGGALKDGSQLFEYQVKCAALIVGRRRLLNSFDMGLGKTRTTLAGLTADDRNKRILIVTMSRNIHDWVREIKVLGLGNDFIILQQPSNMKSNKRIHLVSYEKWAKETLKFKKVKGKEDEYYSNHRLPIMCPSCSNEWPDGKHFCECGETVLSSRKKPLYKYFNRSYDAAAIDEGHLFKNGQTSRCKSIMAIKTKTRVILSGTPAENGASDLFWLLAWLMGDDYHFWNTIAQARFEAYGIYGERSFRHKYGGVSKTALVDSKEINQRASNVSALWDMQDLIMYRKKKQDDDVKNSIRVPKPVHRRLHLEQTQAEKDLYKKVLSDFAQWFADMERERVLAKAKGETCKRSTIEICSWLDKLRLAASCPWIHQDYVSDANVPPSKLTYVREQMQQDAVG